MQLALHPASWNPDTRRRVVAVVARVAAQVLATLPPFLLLAIHGTAGLGQFSVFLAFAGVSVLLEWGQPYRMQNAISRGEFSRPPDLRWLLGEARLLPHMGLNLSLAVLLWLLTERGLPQLLPEAIAGTVLDHSAVVLGMYLMAAVSAALFQSRSVLVGQGHTVAAFVLTLAGTAASLLLLMLGVRLGASVPVLALLAATATPLERLFSAWYCFGRRQALGRHPSLPSPAAAVRPATEAAGWKVSAMFFYLQLLSLVGSNIDALYASRTSSFELVGEYVFLSKLYGAALLVTSILNTMAHPHLAANSRGDAATTSRMLWRLMRSNLFIVCSLSLLVLIGAGWVYELFTGRSTHMLLLSALLFAATVCSAVRGSLSTLLYAEESLTFNMIGNTSFTVSTVPLKIVLVDWAGIYGIVLANVASYVLFLLPFQLRYWWLRHRGS